jgi:hypothetical protein
MIPNKYFEINSVLLAGSASDLDAYKCDSESVISSDFFRML